MDRLALIDDDRNILTSLAVFLEGEGYRVDTYTDAETALREFGRHQPDLAILDVKMPRMDGHEMLRRLRSKHSLPVVMLSSCDDEVDAITGFRMGADDYVTKPFSPRVLLERIRACQRRGSAMVGESAAPAEAQTIERGPLVMDEGRHEVTWNGTLVRLTRIEFRLLAFLAQHPGYVRTRQQMLDLIHGEDFYADARTIDTHIRRLRAKLKVVDPLFDAIQAVYGVGYRFLEPDA